MQLEAAVTAQLKSAMTAQGEASRPTQPPTGAAREPRHFGEAGAAAEERRRVIKGGEGLHSGGFCWMRSSVCV